MHSYFNANRKFTSRPKYTCLGKYFELCKLLLSTLIKGTDIFKSVLFL